MTEQTCKQCNWKADLLPYLPQSVRALLGGLDARLPLEEIRIRAERPVQLCFGGYERLLYAGRRRPPVTAGDCRELMLRLCEHSVYARGTELNNGFLTLPGGYRVGLCGGVMANGESIDRLTDVTGFNIRIARALPGCAEGLLPMLAQSGRLLNTLIVSAPGCGKTTLMRDIARLCSAGAREVKPCRVAVVDTRYELTGSVDGVPQLDIGPRTDVLAGAPRAAGMRMMVVNMAPDIVVTDEIATVSDARAVLDAAACGVTVAASAHAGSVGELMQKRAMWQLLQARVFRRIVLLGRSPRVGTVERVYDEGLQNLPWEGAVCCERLPC